MSDDVKSRIQEKIGTAAGISAGDVGSFVRQQPKEAAEGEEPKPDPMNEDTEVEVTKEAKNTPAQKVSEKHDPAQKEIAKQMDRLASMFKDDIEEKITITAAEKQIFLDTLVTNKRFELPFSLFNGTLKGRFRNRLNRESDALMIELNRRVLEGSIVTDAEYATGLRSGLLMFHVAQLRGEDFPPVEGPLTQHRILQDEEYVVITPKWLDAAIKFYNEMHDGVLAALYRELLRFERKYWLMVKHSSNQNFWKPEDYTSA